MPESRRGIIGKITDKGSYLRYLQGDRSLEDWKVKISVLWLFASITFLAHQIIVLMEPGVLAHLMAGVAEGQEIGPGMILFSSILILVPAMMAFLSLTLKGLLNSRLNIIMGAVFAVLWFFSVIEAIQSAYWGGALLTLSAAVASVLIIWYEWNHRMVS